MSESRQPDIGRATLMFSNFTVAWPLTDGPPSDHACSGSPVRVVALELQLRLRLRLGHLPGLPCCNCGCGWGHSPGLPWPSLGLAERRTQGKVPEGAHAPRFEQKRTHSCGS